MHTAVRVCYPPTHVPTPLTHARPWLSKKITGREDSIVKERKKLSRTTGKRKKQKSQTKSNKMKSKKNDSRRGSNHWQLYQKQRKNGDTGRNSQGKIVFQRKAKKKAVNREEKGRNPRGGKEDLKKKSRKKANKRKEIIKVNYTVHP